MKAAFLITTVFFLALAAACGGGSGPSDVEPQPLLQIEVPASGEILLPFGVSGWALDQAATSGPGIERIEVLDGGCDGQLIGTATYGIDRPDVAEEYGDRFARSGWEFVIDRLTVGEHELAVRLYSALGDASVCETVTVSVL